MAAPASKPCGQVTRRMTHASINKHIFRLLTASEVHIAPNTTKSPATSRHSHIHSSHLHSLPLSSTPTLWLRASDSPRPRRLDRTFLTKRPRRHFTPCSRSRRRSRQGTNILPPDRRPSLPPTLRHQHPSSILQRISTYQASSITNKDGFQQRQHPHDDQLRGC